MSQDAGPADPTSKYLKQIVWYLFALCGYPFAVFLLTVVIASPPYLQRVVRADRQFQHFEGLPLNIFPIGFQSSRQEVAVEVPTENVLAMEEGGKETTTGQLMGGAHESILDIFKMDYWIPTLDAYWLIIYPRWIGVLGLLPGFIALCLGAWCLGRVACVDMLRQGGVQKSHSWAWAINGGLFFLSLVVGYTITPCPMPFIALAVPMACGVACWYTAAKHKA